MKTIAWRIFGTLFVLVQFVFAFPYTVLIYVMRALRVVFMNSALSFGWVFENEPDADLLNTIQMFDLSEDR